MSGWWLVAPDWQEVPGVGGDDVGGEEVEVAGVVGDSVGVEVAFVGVAATVDGAFDLDAEEAAAVVDGEVVGSGLSPGLADVEVEFGGAGHEAQLRPLTPGFGMTEGPSGIWHFGFGAAF